MAGSTIRRGLLKKYSLFVEKETDVLFPILIERNRKGQVIKVRDGFPDATLNGTLIHKKTFDMVGNLSENPIVVSKLMWALEAMDKDCKFKAVLGTKLT